MTREQEQKLVAAVENPLFKGGARLLMWVSSALLGLLLWNGNRAIETIDRLDKGQAHMQTQIERMQVTIDNDRKAAKDSDDTLNDRVTIVSNRLAETQRDYARISDVLSGFTVRDTRIEALDRRIGGLENRMNGPSRTDR